MKWLIWSGLMALVTIGSCAEENPTETGLQARLSIRDAQVFEGNEDKNLSFNVTLTGERTGEVTVKYATINGSAIAGEDFVGIPNNEIMFDQGITSQFIEIVVLGDEDVEEDESFQVELMDPIGAIITRTRATGTILNDDIENVTIDVDIPGGGYESAESYEGMSLVWSDEFRNSGLNLENWVHEMGDGCPNICGWGNNELQYYQPENAGIANGEFLVIEARQEQVGSRSYTSSRIISKDLQEFRYGRIDVRAALPKGQGIWPAIWMLGGNIDQVGWPSCGEIDIMELIGNEPSTLHGTAHWSASDGNHAFYGQHTDLDSGDFSDAFHVFSIIWDNDSIQWLLDDKPFNILDTSPPELSEFRGPFFIIFNIAVGGNWPGNPNQSTEFPQHLIIDYIRVFQEL